MEIELTEDQQNQVEQFIIEAQTDFRKGDKGVVHAQVYEKFMSVHYINPKCSGEMRAVMRRHYPKRFKKKEVITND